MIEYEGPSKKDANLRNIVHVVYLNTLISTYWKQRMVQQQ